MGSPPAPRSGSQKAGTTQDPQPTRDPRRRLLRPEERLPLAAVASGLKTPWETVYWWFGRWRTDGTFERLNAALRERLRTRLGRNPLPSAGIADSQSTKSTGVGGEQRGYDGHKKVRGILSATCSWTPRVCSSKRRFTARRCPTRTGLGSYSSRRAPGFRASSTCGWTPDTRGGAGAGP